MESNRIEGWRIWAPWAGVLVLCLGIAANRVGTGPGPSGAGPSFVVIAVDSLRADHVGTYGYERDTTPQIDALADRGVTFDVAVSQAPVTGASVASILTSRYVGVHGVFGHARRRDGRLHEHALADRFVTLAEALQAGGYATAGFGWKPHLRKEHGFDQGFDRYDMRFGLDADQLTWRGLEWLRSSRPERFFLYLHYNDPHFPYSPPEEFRHFGARESRVPLTGDSLRAFRSGELPLTDEDIASYVDLYDGEVAFADRQIGELVRGIATLGYHDAVVVITADHGEEFLEHGALGHGQSVHAELVSVPLIFTGPGVPEPLHGARVAQPAELIDLMPTLLELAGVAEPEGLQGRSWAGFLTGVASPELRPVFTSREGPGAPTYASAVLTDGFKLVRDPETSRDALFDLTGDPQERRPIETGEPEIVARLARELDAWERRNAALSDGTGPETTVPLAPDTEAALRALGYVD